MANDDRRPRKSTIVLGAELKDDRTVQRRHVGYESPEPPPDSAISEWPPEVRTDPGWPRVERVPPSSDSVQLKIPSKLVVAMIGAIVTAALGGVGFTKATEKPAASPELVVDMTKKLERRLANIEDYLAGTAADQLQRDAVQIAVLCAINNGAPARSVRCPVNACEPRALDEKGKLIPDQPICKSRDDWPTVRRPP